MEKDNSQHSDESVLSYSDDENESGNMDQSQLEFQNNSKKDSLNQKLNGLALNEKQAKTFGSCLVSKQIELMYIIFCSYKEHLQEIATSLGCEVKLILNQYKVTAMSSQSKFQDCKKIISNQISKIKYEKIKDQSKKFKMYYSKYINQEASKQEISLCKFNKEVYVYTNQLTTDELIEKMRILMKIANMHSIFFMYGNSKSTINAQINKFMQTVIEIYKKDRFQPKKLIVEIDRSSFKINVIGELSKDIMAAKNTMKNAIESMTCIAIKNFMLDQKGFKTLQKYLAKISPDYPIHLCKISQQAIMLISKDLILQQLFKKTQRVIQYFGITNQTQFGVLVPSSHSRVQKKAQIFNLCKDQGYDYYDNAGVKYFRKMVITEGQVLDCRQFIVFLIKLIHKFMEVKEKFQIMSKHQQIQNKKKFILEQSKQPYQVSGNKVQNEQLKILIRRDNHEDNVIMKQKLILDYKLFQGVEIGEFYFQRTAFDKNEIKLIQKNKMKRGQFLLVKLKVPQGSFTSLQKDLQHILKKLQSQLSVQNSNKHYQERSVVHLIEKIIYVY